MSNLPPNWLLNRPNGARNFSMGTTCNRNNAVANYNGSTTQQRWRAMPQKFQSSAGDSMFSINRLTYSRVYDGNTCDDTCIDNSLSQLSERERRRNSGKPLQHMDSGQRTAIRRQRAIGKSSRYRGLKDRGKRVRRWFCQRLSWQPVCCRRWVRSDLAKLGSEGWRGSIWRTRSRVRPWPR